MRLDKMAQKKFNSRAQIKNVIKQKQELIKQCLYTNTILNYLDLVLINAVYCVSITTLCII